MEIFFRFVRRDDLQKCIKAFEMRTLSSRGRTDNTLFTANSTGVDCLRALGDFENSADGYKKDKLMVVKLHILGQETF